MPLIVFPSAHALGFLHEQERPDRDQYVTILKENLQDGKDMRRPPCDYITVNNYKAYCSNL